MQVGKDFHNNVNVVRGISPIAIGTTGTGQTTAAIDRSGYGAVEFIVEYGAVTTATGVHTVLITESDASTGGFTSVADTDLLGTELAAGLAAATRVSGTTQHVKKKVGYIGTKKYVKAKVSSTATAGTLVSITPLLVNPRHAPVT